MGMSYGIQQPVSWINAYTLSQAYEIAQGLAYLHAQGIVHERLRGVRGSQLSKLYSNTPLTHATYYLGKYPRR